MNLWDYMVFAAFTGIIVLSASIRWMLRRKVEWN